MSDLIDRQALLKQIDIDSDGEPGYYGDTWKFIDTIKNMPNVHDLPKDTDTISRAKAIKDAESWVAVDEYEKHLQKNVIEWLKEFPSAEHGTNLAEVGADCISRQAAIDALNSKRVSEDNEHMWREYRNDNVDMAIEIMQSLPPAQPEIIYCKDCKKQNRHYHESPYKNTVCPLTAWRGKAQGHEYDYQYCCFAEKKEVTE